MCEHLHQFNDDRTHSQPGVEHLTLSNAYALSSPGLSGSAAELRYMLDESAIVSETDNSGTLTYVNEKFCALSGYPQEMLLGENHRILNSNIHSVDFFENLWRTIAAGQIWRGEICNLAQDGRLYWVSTTIVAKINPESQQPEKYTSISFDITARKLLEHAEVTLAAIGDAVIATDIQGNVTFINLAAIQLTGWGVEDAIGKPIKEIVHRVHATTRRSIQHDFISMSCPHTVKNTDHILLISHSGSEHHIEETITPVYLKEGALTGFVLVLRNVTERHELIKAVHWQAGHDLLTGLPNRALLADRFNCALINTQRQGCLLGVCKMDLDDFKQINDLYGHVIGDQLLVEVTTRMNSVIRGEDTLARLGGDEFVLLIGNLQSADEMQVFLQRILVAIATPYAIENNIMRISCSVGITIYPLDKADPDTLLRHADQAMYKAKQSGRNCIHLFDVEDEQLTQNSYQTRERVRRALVDNELVLYYQPKVNMRRGEIIGMEALLRWQHPERGMVPPLAFLPLVEQTDLIIDIGEWVIKQALRQIAVWSEAHINWVVSVNIAARHFQHPAFLERLTEILARYPQVPANLLEIEILETVALGDIESVRRLIHSCQALGVTFSLDDFGTGYSSLSYLKRLPADILKVDQSFVRDMLDNQEDLALIEAVVGLATAFNRQVIAEGVETPEHGLLLMSLGCDLGQGYGIARPMPASEVMTWAKQFKPADSWGLWANAHWSLQDFPLLVAQYEHIKWLKKILNILENPQLLVAEIEHKEPSICRFGQWYESYGALHYQELPEFAVIGSLHHHIHELGAKVLEKCIQGEFDLAQLLGKQLVEAHERIITQLLELQLAIANTKLTTATAPAVFA